MNKLIILFNEIELQMTELSTLMSLKSSVLLLHLFIKHLLSELWAVIVKTRKTRNIKSVFILATYFLLVPITGELH